MGATTFAHIAYGKFDDLDNIFEDMRQRDLHAHGHNCDSGTIGQKEHYIVYMVRTSKNNANIQIIIDAIERNKLEEYDKWGCECGVIVVTKRQLVLDKSNDWSKELANMPDHKDCMFYFFGVAAD